MCIRDSGTAVVTTVFKKIAFGAEEFNLPILSEEESYALLLKKALVDIQTNKAEDPFGWRLQVEKHIFETA